MKINSRFEITKISFMNRHTLVENSVQGYYTLLRYSKYQSTSHGGINNHLLPFRRTLKITGFAKSDQH